jgi:hypothetical protein
MLSIPRGFRGDANAFPYSVEAAGDRPGIAQMAEGRFHVWRSGALGNLLPTASAILISRDLAGFLSAETIGGWVVREITIVDPPDGEIRGYVQLVIANELTPDSLPLDVSGNQLWRFGTNHFFVSPDLGRTLATRFDDLLFSLGFSRFAG